MELKKALEELRKEKKRKFSQSVDLIINLKGFDLRKDTINVVVNVPYKIKDKKVCGFLDKKSDIIRTITKPEFVKYKDKGALKKLVNDYDFFVSLAPLMPSVATTFGKVLGPAGKMPSPQLGIIPQQSDEIIKKELEKVAKAVKIRTKESSIKLNVGNEDMSDEELMANVNKIYQSVLNALPRKKDNLKNLMLKFTMSKPIKIDIGGDN